MAFNSKFALCFRNLVMRSGAAKLDLPNLHHASKLFMLDISLHFAYYFSLIEALRVEITLMCASNNSIEIAHDSGIKSSLVFLLLMLAFNSLRVPLVLQGKSD